MLRVGNDNAATLSAEKPSVPGCAFWRLDPAESSDSFFERFGSTIVSRGIVDAASLDRAMRAALKTNDRLDLVLLKLGLIEETRLCDEIASALNLAVVKTEDVPTEEVDDWLFSPQFVRNRRILPLKVDRDRIVIAEVDPFDSEPRAALAYMSGRVVETRMIENSAFQKAYHRIYDKLPSTTEQLDDHRLTEVSDADVERLRDIASEAPVIKLVSELITEAVDARASDVHLEPAQNGLDVRFRINGHLHPKHSFPSGLQAAVTSRIKIMARLDIAEKRMPQDGRIRMPIKGVDVDFRVSTIPIPFGESIVLRILDRSRVALDFPALGFSADDTDAISSLAKQPNGIFLVTGPTGSGKTTTLYTALSGINRPSTKIFTVEDPVEYQLAGINQVQVQPSIGLDFPHALRSILRQDPDVIMIGEIRDLETAKIAIQASLTGHLVLSTLHTNSAAGTVTRLIDMGIQPYLLASTLNGILAQRLVRRLCEHCARPHPHASMWESRIRDELGARLPTSPQRIGAECGCPKCQGTGFTGRLAITELLVMDKRQRAHVLSGSAETELENAGEEAGFNKLYISGLLKVWAGQTTIEDVLSSTKGTP
ncbi:Flp pilus assembly complex ATPase component TadA [Rhizobium laguerreae]|uniref:GspE/PulE family protein n=1 Tax=Rhizobium laguerreae TaxID=1076926 RepID=UPI001C8FFD95|nr:ATPase, T2SS/T4P/T4SS family [Rhizobium laguerreae]MBY3328767.1 Flp pilus assembly complex ATPase component TadA [Rhizobium laguerreae]